MSNLTFSLIKLKRPEDDLSINVIIGQTHFIKTVEDIHEALVNAVPGVKYGLAFCEASGPKLIRFHSTDSEMEKLAIENAKEIKAGHTFVLFLKDTFPVNVLKAVRDVAEVCNIFCATANPLQVIIAESEQGRGVVGVIDGNTTDEVEGKEEKAARHKFLRDIGYKQ